MIDFFKYNWKVREDWFERASKLSDEALLKERQGGLGSILKTLFHITDVECSWIQAIHGDKVSEPNYEDYKTLDLVWNLSRENTIIVQDHVAKWKPDQEFKLVTVPWSSQTFYYGEVLRHVIAHQIHHIGQLSVWGKELGLETVNVNYVGRGFMEEISGKGLIR